MDVPDMIRQGDLLFIRIDSVPMGFRPAPGRTVLAYGEVTGHSHRVEGLADGDGDVAVLENPSGELIVDGRVTPRRIPHEEHDAVVLSALYRIVRQREYDPDAVMRERQVAD